MGWLTKGKEKGGPKGRRAGYTHRRGLSLVAGGRGDEAKEGLTESIMLR